jgi:hypothetical protein
MDLTQEEKQQLKGELGTLQVLIKKMQKDYGIMPDFMRARGKKGHLVVVRKGDGVHLVMLDNGVYDEKGDPTPALHYLNEKFAGDSIKKQIKKLEG